jgi:hypothetical protein
MDKTNFAHDIRGAWRLLSTKLGIGRQIISEMPLNVDHAFRDAALDSETSYADLYKIGLSRSHYNILLHDYAYFQFSLDGTNSWRLGYYPNPWISGAPSAVLKAEELEALEETGAATHEDITELFQEMPYVGSIPPIRFDCSPGQYKEIAHPAAHFHIGMYSKNRWPCSYKIRPVTFSLIIAKMYYNERWANYSTYYNTGVTDCLDTKLIQSLANDGKVWEFSTIERRSPHLGCNIAEA